MFAAYAFDLDRVGASRTFLLAFLALAVVAGTLFWVGFLGRVIGLASAIIHVGIRTGFRLWQRLFSWALWPGLLGLVFGILVVGVECSSFVPFLPLLCGAVLLFLGVVSCLAYVAIDLERYEVARGYKALHNPLQGQELAADLVRYGNQVGVPLLAAAALGVVGGFALLNQGLYETVGRNWYRLGEGGQEPEFSDFLAYTLLNLFGVVDLLHLASSYNFVHASYVHQARWPASTLLTMFKSFFTLVMLQQIFASVRRGRMLWETVADFWSPHVPIHERARGALPQYGTGVVWPLLQSMREVPALTAEQRDYIPRVLADVGPAAIPALTGYLGDPVENVRAVAVRALGLLHAVDAVPHMAALAGDSSPAVRQALVEALGDVAEVVERPTRRRRLRRVFASSTWLCRRVRGSGRPAARPDLEGLVLSVLRSAMKDPVAAVRGRAAASLGNLGRRAERAVPDLIALLDDRDEAVRSRAAETLGTVGVGDPRAIAALVALLAEPSTSLRVTAALALGAMNGKAAEAVPSLTPLLQDGDEEVRAAAAIAIGRIGALGPEAVREMARGLHSPDTLIRAQTAEALGTIGAPAAEAAPALATALTDSNDRVRAKAAEALGQMGEAAAAAVPGLVRALHDADTWVIALAAEALGEVGTSSPDMVRALVRSLRHANPQVRANAAGALAKHGEASQIAAPALARAATDADDMVRVQAVTALGEIGGPDGEPSRVLRAALDDTNPAVRAAAVAALAKRHEEGTASAVLRMAADAYDEVKVQVAQALPGLCGAAPAALEVLCHLLRDSKADVRTEAAAALGRLGPEAAAAGEDLLQLTQSGEETVREQALRAMTLIQPPQAGAAFLVGLKDARPDVRMVASAGLIKAPTVPPDAVPAVIDALRDPEPRVRANAARVLTRLESLPADAIASLSACAADPDDGVRLNAALALRLAPPAQTKAAFVQLVADVNPRIRLLAAGSLLIEEPTDPEAANVVVAALNDSTPRLRLRALELIESLRPTGAAFLEPLRQRAAVEIEPELSDLLEGIIEALDKPAPVETETTKVAT